FSPTSLSEYLGHDIGALTRVVDELERLGFVQRGRSREDRRAVEIAITPDGRDTAEAGKRVVVELLNRLVEPDKPAEIDSFIRQLQRFLLQMQEIEKVDAALEHPPAQVQPLSRRSRGRSGKV